MIITSQLKLNMVIGNPVSHSLSPKMHNAGYKALGTEKEYTYLACSVKPEDIPGFLESIKSSPGKINVIANQVRLGEAISYNNGINWPAPIRGVSCTIPHKQLVLPYLDEIDVTAKAIGAVNTIVNNGGRLKGYNTDWLGVIKPLEQLAAIKGKHVALLGAGGAARAVIYGITQKGGKVTIFNRTLAKALELAKEFNCTALSLDRLEEVNNMDIIFNATSVGLYPEDNETPLSAEYIHNKHIVFDAVYNPHETRLLREAKNRGAKIIHGIEMLLYQGTEQFKLFTGHDAPVEAMRQALLDYGTLKL